MDINQIIASGLLELYVLGLATAEETRQVEDWRAQYPQLNDEIARIEITVQDYMKQYDKTPPGGLKEKILAEIGAQKDAGKTPQRAKLQSRWMQYGIAASIALLAGSITLNYIFFNRWKDSENRLAQLEGEKQALVAQAETQRKTMGVAMDELEMLKSPSIKMVSLSGMKNPDDHVTVYWDTAKNDVMVNINNLPPAPDDKQYQLWALVDGKPVDAGMMETGVASLQKLKSVNKAQAFAITLEKRGGAATPDLEQLYVIGHVKS